MVLVSVYDLYSMGFILWALFVVALFVIARGWQLD